MTTAATLVTGPKCPNCGGIQLSHDKFEDMYRCPKCEVFFYPVEVGMKDDPNAGYMKLPG